MYWITDWTFAVIDTLLDHPIRLSDIEEYIHSSKHSNESAECIQCEKLMEFLQWCQIKIILGVQISFRRF